MQQDCPTGVQLSADFGVNSVPTVGEHYYDVCIITPGLAPHTILAQSACEQSAEVISEVELAYRLSPPGLNWVAITGTNGKTTTTELVREVLSAQENVQVFSVGNIGTPALELLASVRPGDFFIAEVSSFQAARLSTFKPRVAALLNLSSDHLDWHKDIARYGADKCRIFANSGNGDLVLVPEEDELHELARPVIAAAVLAAEKRGACVRKISADEHCLPLEKHELRIRGDHNMMNACFATAIGHYFGVPDTDISKALKSFQPQPHRMQEIGIFEDVIYVNDSKSTNPDASISALSAYAGLELTLLLGGQSKDVDYLDLVRAALVRAQTILLFGQAAVGLKSHFDALSTGSTSDQQILTFESMKDAVHFACKNAAPKQVVLLSPANASFDEFDDFEHRGCYFTSLVKSFHEAATKEGTCTDSYSQNLDSVR